ncbi:MAG: transketolase, partial [Planctomycetaceae bacterium]
MLSDGELDEGSNWESVLFAGHHRLGQLTAIVEYNGIQSLGNVADVLELHPLAEKFRSFRWDVVEIDGHDVDQIAAALLPHRAADAPPLAVVARTVKGKGVDFMEHQLK